MAHILVALISTALGTLLGLYLARSHNVSIPFKTSFKSPFKQHRRAPKVNDDEKAVQAELRKTNPMKAFINP